MDTRKAITLAREIAACLGGEQAEALEQLCRIAERGQRPSQQVQAVEHFRAARKALDDPEE